MTLIFKTTAGPNPKGRFEPRNKKLWSKLGKTLAGITDQLNNDSITKKQALMDCLLILKQEPQFLAAMTVITEILFCGNAKIDDNFLEVQTSYVSQVQELIPRDFPGTLDDGDVETSYFLSSHLYMLFSLLMADQYPKALKACQEQIAWTGNQDLATMEGNIHISMGNLSEAGRIFTRFPVPTPYESPYSLGLLSFLAGEYSEAIHILRKAMILQPYVAEITMGRSPAVNYSWNLADNEALFSNAMNYCNIFLGSDIWQSDPKRLRFLSWLYGCPPMLIERGKAWSLLNKLLYLPPGRKAEAEGLRAEFLRLAMAPDPCFAEAVMDKVPWDGRMLFPWELGPLQEEPAWEPPRPQARAREGQAAGAEAGEDCGDCEECDIFEECQSSPPAGEDGCEECDECEIEGFCQGEATPWGGRKPPSRH